MCTDDYPDDGDDARGPSVAGNIRGDNLASQSDEARLGARGRRRLLLLLPLLELLELGLAERLRRAGLLRLSLALSTALGDLLRNQRAVVSLSQSSRGSRRTDTERALTAFSDSTVDRRESRPASDMSVSCGQRRRKGQEVSSPARRRS